MTYGGAAALLGPGWAFLSLLAVVPWLWLRAGRRVSERLLLETLAAGYVTLLVGLTFFPLPLPPYPDASPVWAYRDFANVTPFATIGDSFSRGLYWPAIRFVVGNVVAFLPLGALVALLARRPSLRLALLVGLAVSAAIEAGQLGVSLLLGFPYRHADVDDVILNVAGTWIGYGTIASVLRRARA